MQSSPGRVLRRALVTIMAIALFVPLLSGAGASATPLLNGKVTTVGTVVPRGIVTLSSDFGYASQSGSYLYNTEVRDRNGKKIAQWVETLWTSKGQKTVRTYRWDTKYVADGTYTLVLGISKPNWTGLISWNDNAGSLTLAASNAWKLSSASSVTASATGTAPVAINTRFVAPSDALGTYVLDVEVFDDNTGRKVQQWFQSKYLAAGQSAELNRSFDRSALPAGQYHVSQGVWTESWRTGVLWKSGTSTVVVPASVPSTTTTTVPPTTTTVPPTTTTVPPTTTTVPPTTTTTVPPTTTTVPPTTTTTVPPTTTTVPPTTTTTVPPTTTTVPAYNSGWQLKFQEDFDGTSLDRTHWATYDGRGNEGVGYRSSSHDVVNNGELTIIGTKADLTAGGMCMCGSANTPQTYGRWEIRAKMDKGNGFGPAMLLWPDSNVWPNDGEIDISEMPRGDRTQSFFTTHYGSNNSQIGYASYGDFSQWHTFALEWMPDHLTYFLDGVPMKTITTPAAIPTKPMHLALQNDVGAAGHWISAPDASTPDQVNLHVDWVKVYR